MFKKFSLSNYKKILSFFWIYKSIIIWCILMQTPLSFFSNSVYIYSNLLHISILAIITPILAVGLWLDADWSVVIWFLTMLIDGLFLWRFYYTYNSQILVIFSIYTIFFIIYCLYKAVEAYRKIIF